MDGVPTYEGALSESQALRHIPKGLVEQIRSASGDQYLHALALAALEPRCTEWVFFAHEPLFVDLAARWFQFDAQIHQFRVIEAFSRILPFAPYLRSFASQYATSQAVPFSTLAASRELTLLDNDDFTIRSVLLSLFRLLSFDLETFSSAVSPIQLQSLFRHSDRCIRYLAIRCFCLHMHAADAATDKMLLAHMDDQPVKGKWEGLDIDYRLVGLWEEQRWTTLETLLRHKRDTSSMDDELDVEKFESYLTNHTANIGGVLVPKVKLDIQIAESALVKTPTVLTNLQNIAKSLLRNKPLLLVGLPNSGKTSLVNDIARATGQRSSMVTLHLNEQTDAKSLLGMYATSSMTGAFAWQPGVLTKAAREGRWILIEDLDRAPSEVIGLILPIIERGELIIPSRKERIKCADGFRIFATMRSSLDNKGDEIAPGHSLLGIRLWDRIRIASLSLEEISQVISQKFPLLSSRVPTLMEIYDRLCSAFTSSLAVRSSQGRTPGFRDLIKLCSRLHRRLLRLGFKTGDEPTPENLQDEMFLDAVDVLLRYLPDRDLCDKLSSVAAEVLQLSPQQAQYCLHSRVPPYSDRDNTILVGRETCTKMKVSKTAKAKYLKNSSRFAPTRAALKIMEQIAAAVEVAEPVLLVGETGIGKTAVVQQLSNLMRQQLTVVNLSQQSESTDLLGGFRPVNLRSLAVPLLDEFNPLFEQTFSAKKNQKFLSSVTKSVTAGNWARLVHLWHEAVRMAQGVFRVSRDTDKADHEKDEQPAKKRKLDSPKYQALKDKWDNFETQLKEFEAQATRGDSKFAFAFVQGKIVRALRNGEWVLLDEINLASPDILENVASLLHHGDEGRPSVLLSEAGDVERVYGHPDFRIFGAMNPATDAGKRDLAPGLRSRFTEVYVQSPDTDFDDLLGLIQTYLGDLTRSDHRVAADLAHLYSETKKLSAKNQLTDGVGQKPHFSIRTLVRTLIYIVDHVQVYGIRRAAYEGFCMSFLTLLSQESEKIVVPLIERHIFGSTKNARSLLGQTPKSPNDGNEYVQFIHYWMRKGPFKPEGQAHYIITPFIEKNLKNLLRASSTRRFPILLQGPTSSGKTSMVEYLAKISGNKFLRINNHEHTDLQEYLGTYVSTDDGSLRYQEGVLVEALRHGYWIVLDELNLAPSDVLEALNRLLDDNRELFLPETQEVIHPHPNFMLFATQNPAGLYGGRKVLSRAFRNRFLELHFDDIPEDELEYILKERTQIAPSFCARIVTVYKKLSLLRQTTRLFEQKNSFATLRDLFRWALRRADDRETLAVNGFMLLAERVRNAPERAAVKQVIEDVMRVRIDEDAIYSSEELERRVQDVQDANNLSRGVVWTKAMRRVFILISQALENNEPVLLVGETGSGKTQICQAVAEIHRKDLFIVNAHVNLETGDLIGAQRPVRNRAAVDQQLYDDLRTLLHATPKLNNNLEDLDLEQLKATFFQLDLELLEAADTEIKQRIKINLTRSQALFEWSDGSLITAMKTGQYFLLDEVSLADDSVLERLNSVLEPHRSLLLAEKGPVDSLVVAHEGFQFVSTMNPGGDYGKRELSAALRNRLTEIWVPQLSEDKDILPILVAKLNVQDERSAKAMLDFAKWFKQSFQNSSATSVSIRDLLAWVEFINKCPPSEPEFALVHGAAMVYIDTLGANPSAMLSMAPESLGTNRALCIQKLTELFGFDAGLIYNQSSTVSVQNGNMCVGPFILPMSSESMPDPQFVMDAPTTVANSVRIARGLQLSKPILLEGSPGVGKTTLVASLARVLGKPLTRINLSEQTDLTDLFGSDVPVEGGTVGQFAWRDAPFLQAMQRGDWVLLDEMNLASQSVLEGLNSCLDHRQQVYVAELDQTFKRHPEFVLFAAQNPHHQGGGRKGLPASFVNRFTVVYADCFSDVDLKRICSKLFPANEQIEQVVDFVSRLNIAINFERKIGAVGGPWEMNLRDITRWLQLADCEHISSGHFLDNIISHRFRTEDDRILISQVFKQSFGELPPPKSYYHDLSWDHFQVGSGFMQRDPIIQNFLSPTSRVLPRDLPIFESLILCIERAWPSILVGASGCGKTTTIRKLAALNGAHLVELALSADTDTMDLIGGFEQIDHRRQIASLAKDLKSSLHSQIISSLIAGDFSSSTLSLLQIHETCQTADISVDKLLSSVSFLKNNYPALDNAKLLHRCNLLAQMSQNSRKVGFEWTEGALTEAIQHGHWVVLDNANLCNPSVLDRLNSLMEPNGYLVLNEQRTEDSSARVVVPHPNFRLFLTMDPRNGELSRAMRNRSVEICFLPQHLREIEDSTRPTYLSQSVLYRLRHMWKLHEAAALNKFDDNSVNVCLDHLAVSDLDRFRDSIEKFAYTSANFDSKPFISTLERYISVMEESSDWKMALEYRNTNWRGSLVTIHPLLNEPRLTALPMSLDPMTILGYLQELKLDLHRLQQNLSKAELNSQQLKPSQMTRLERSLSSRRIAALMKDPTQPVGEFLRDCLQILHRFIQSLDRTTTVSRQMLSALVAIYRFCYDIFTITQSKDMDEEKFQTYLQIGQDIQSSAIGQTLLLSPLILDVGHLLARFQSTWALKTGLSMQRIWESWRPITCVEKFQLECLLDLEETISEFTHVALQTRLSLPQLSMVRKLLVDAQRSIVRDQADGKILLHGLKQQVKDFKSATDIYSLSQPPHFTDIFETLCRYHDLPSIWYPSAVDEIESLSDTVQLLAGRAAHPLSASNLQSSVPGILQKLSLYRGSETSSSASSAFSESFSLSLLQRLGHVNDVTLGRLEFLENEQLVLAKAVASSSHEISLNQAGLLSRAFARICLEIIDLHQDFLEAQISVVTTQALKEVERQGQYEGPAVPQLLPVQTLSEQHYFREYVEEISKCVQILTTPNGDSGSDLFNMGLVSVQLAVICLRLFVPDKQYDPSLGLAIQRRRHAEHVLQLTAKEQALMKFEVEFSGQQGNLRRALVQQELQDLGSEPPAPPVTRPNKSQLTQLQGEFSNLITSVLSRKPEKYGPSEFRDYAHLLRNNINQICRRLRLGFRFYDDITILVTRFLEMLDLGMSLSLSVVAGVSNSTSMQRISDMTPFLGGGKHPLLRADPCDQNSSLDLSLDVQLQELSVLVAAHSADLSTLKTPSGLQAISDIFHHFYTIWKTQLRDEQKEEAERTQMYRYRGSFEDNEEIDETEFQALFPNYETAPESSDQSRLDPRSFSLKLSQLHSAIFAPGDVRTRLREFIVESARLLGSHSSQMGSSSAKLPPKSHLPGILLLLTDDMKKFEQVPLRSYNFYSDPNVAQAKKLVSLVLSTQSRFIQLQTSWPEHAAIQDVLVCCQEILQFKHIEPVAKFLTKVEKLHALVYEWQLVASREFSATTLFDSITTLIINWRRLELSTWAKLLDLEYEKCEQEASSWWFVAYEVLMAVPFQMIESGEDLTRYINETVATFENFFKSTTMGQYSARLRLVELFMLLLVLYGADYPALKPLVSALDNFLQHYRAFESVISQSLENGRKSLENDVKQQIQLASWKDTNITALRESAKRSHYKLFKYVRKYRALLSQPVESILQQGMPEYHDVITALAKGETMVAPSSGSTQAIAICREHDALWIDRAPRFRDPTATASSMLRVYASSVTEFDIASQLGTFVADVIESIKDFKSQTPGTLTEENKDNVQHLKTQKRRFYADTLRQLHVMGVRRNVSTAVLEEQASVSQILATTPSLRLSNSQAAGMVKSSDSYFHNFLDLLPRVRQASRDYNEDLNPVEVTRSIGSAEGFLWLIRKQRELLCPAISASANLSLTSDQMRDVWKNRSHVVQQKNTSQFADTEQLVRCIAWLIPLLDVGTEIIEIHSKLSGRPSISQTLQRWRDNFAALQSRLARLPDLPAGISLQTASDISQEAIASLNQLKSELSRSIQERPDLSFVLEQIDPWISIAKSTNAVMVNADLAVEAWSDEYLSAVDRILVALQALKNTLSLLPSSTDDKDWLSRTDSILIKAVQALHMSEISACLTTVLDKMQFLELSGPGPTLACAIIGSLLPITDQYLSICDDLLARYLSLHREVCKMSYVLSKSFAQVASEGFCSPSEASTEEGKSGKVESGTGLGDGEGAEDISKDVQDDEDLTDLAQQDNTEQSGQDIDQSREAVDMDQEDLEGDFDKDKEDVDGDESDSEEGENDDEIDDEVGSVDDLDPTAVDEKLWDGSHEDEQKETENEEGKGISESDKQAASNEKKLGEQQQDGDEPGDDEEEPPEDEGEAVGREEMDVTDPHAKEEQTLDLPEEMQLDGEEKEDAGSDMDDGLDDLSDLGQEVDEEQTEHGQEETMEDESTANAEDIDMVENGEDENAEGEDKGEAEQAGEEEPAEDEPEQQDIMRSQRDDNDAAENNIAPSEAVSGGMGADQDLNEEKGTSGDAQQEGGSKDAGTEEQPNGAAEDGQDRQKAEDTAGGTGDDAQENPQAQAFKKLGDVLEQWHRRQREIMNSTQAADSQTLPPDTNMDDAEFEHLADEDDAADTQALGQASEEQAKALDQKKGVESEAPTADNELLPDIMDDEKPMADDKTLEEAQMDIDSSNVNDRDGVNSVGSITRIGERTDESVGVPPASEELEEVDSQLAAIHLSSALAPRTSGDEARRLWSHYEAATNNLSLSLTEQLRLILAPTLATKLRGDFRTGKRLNIKRIIPYIASQYKRDKIWMRRSIPSKRNYQIMLAVDDSKSMMESGSGQLAFETLALVARSLSMLEAGDLCVVGFGDEEHVRVAHEFGKPFSSEAGIQVFQQFSYQQTGTNVRKLVADSIALFREARARRSGGGSNSADLWQLELIISDGICEDHDTIRRLVRQAQEERIMIVFIILDAAKGSSILDLTQASFEPDDSGTGTGEMKLKMKRYLEGFPFAYYLVVRDVRELPAVLAMALKQWFAEVVDSSA